MARSRSCFALPPNCSALTRNVGISDDALHERVRDSQTLARRQPRLSVAHVGAPLIAFAADTLGMPLKISTAQREGLAYSSRAMSVLPSRVVDLSSGKSFDRKRFTDLGLNEKALDDLVVQHSAYLGDLLIDNEIIEEAGRLKYPRSPVQERRRAVCGGR